MLKFASLPVQAVKRATQAVCSRTLFRHQGPFVCAFVWRGGKSLRKMRHNFGDTNLFPKARKLFSSKPSLYSKAQRHSKGPKRVDTGLWTRVGATCTEQSPNQQSFRSNFLECRQALSGLFQGQFLGLLCWVCSTHRP